MTRLPIPGSDDGNWGDLLNDFLSVSHNADGTIDSGAVSVPDDSSTQRIVVAKDGADIGTRPKLHFVSGANTTLTVADNPGSNRVDVTIAAAAPPTSLADNGAAALGLVAHTINPCLSQSSFTLNSGVCVFAKVYLPTTTITTLGAWKTNEATGTASGTCGMALYSSSGTLIDQTASMASVLLVPSNAWVSAGLVGGPRAVTAGPYYVAFLSNMSVGGPRIAGTQAFVAVPAINGHYPSVYLTGQGTFPASFNPATATQNSGIYYLTVH